VFVIDFQEASLVGTSLFKIEWFTLHQLKTKVSKEATRKYLAILEKNLCRHLLIKHLGETRHRHRSKSSFQRAINKKNKQSKELMANAEKRCQMSEGISAVLSVLGCFIPVYI
jgi:hypothetical protein